jgi:arylsulfatase A-like enzyme
MKNLPNIILLHCHDVGDHLGCYPDNSAQTPNLDRLAGEGVVFDNYFAAAPTCSPSRGAMLTGVYPHRNGLIGLANSGHMRIPPGTPTIGAILNDLGYETASFGIWHVSTDFREHGIEAGNYSARCDQVSANVVDYLRTRRTDRPFFLMAGTREPHRIENRYYTDRWPALQDPSAVRIPPYLRDEPDIREEMVRFYGDVSLMDAAVGEILAALDELGLTEETITVFTSDHGIAMPFAKGTLYDPGVKIPLIMRYPKTGKGGKHSSALASNVDLLPTLLDGLGKGNLVPSGLDGHSLWPAVENGAEVSHEHIFCEQTWHDFYEPIRALRTNRFKLIRNFHPGTGLQVAADILQSSTTKTMRDIMRKHPRPEYELYDLQDDPRERTNIVGREDITEIECQLKMQLDAWLNRTNDPVLKGVVPAPSGYIEYYMASPTGPGGLPPAAGEEEWHTWRWPIGAAVRQSPQ